MAKLGIYTLRDLVYHFPRAYENRGDVRLLGDYMTDGAHSYILTVATAVSNSKIKNNMTISKFRAFDESGSCEIVFFNAPFVKDVFHIGDSFRFYGKTAFNKTNRLSLSNPKYELISDSVPLDDFIPIYPLTDGLSSKVLDKLIKTAINDILPFIVDPLPDSIRTKEGLPTLSFAIKNVHFPKNESVLGLARRRLAFDEMMYFALGIAISAEGKRKTNGVPFSPCSIKPLLDALPYELTGAQKRAVNDIYSDTVLKKNDGITPAMSRIVVGDVGCGKTVVAAIAIYIAYKSGFQSSLMVPTEILANQHFEDMSELLGGLGLNVALLTGSLSAVRKRKIYDGIASGGIDLVIGTHALLSDKVNFANLGLIITDEQHRFGVAQRAVLKDKISGAHMLVMSATPIPRTLALALYGDLDISRIDEMPKGRQKVDTYLVDESYRTRLNDFIKKQVSLGGQCYIVCPSIESDEDNDEFVPTGIDTINMVSTSSLNLKNATDYTEELKRALPDISIECLHGKMKNSEKDEIMSRFAEGITQVLVSTTVIEVGVNIPNASLMIVENADRFGLSQLHQLRGRVGRGKRKSYCVLVSDSKTEKAASRLEVMKSTYDGYEIAEKDLMLRGPGDFFSSISNHNLRQSGGFDFTFAADCDDTSLFDAAFSYAKSIAKSDPTLSQEEHTLLRCEVQNRITKISEIS